MWLAAVVWDTEHSPVEVYTGSQSLRVCWVSMSACPFPLFFASCPISVHLAVFLFSVPCPVSLPALACQPTRCSASTPVLLLSPCVCCMYTWSFLFSSQVCYLYLYLYLKWVFTLSVQVMYWWAIGSSQFLSLSIFFNYYNINITITFSCYIFFLYVLRVLFCRAQGWVVQNYEVCLLFCALVPVGVSWALQRKTHGPTSHPNHLPQGPH